MTEYPLVNWKAIPSAYYTKNGQSRLLIRVFNVRGWKQDTKGKSSVLEAPQEKK